MVTSLLVALLLLAVPMGGDASDPIPADKDVTAGGIALLVFVFLILAVVVLARSFVKQLRKAQAAREAGVYGDPPATPDAEAADESREHPASS